MNGFTSTVAAVEYGCTKHTLVCDRCGQVVSLFTRRDVAADLERRADLHRPVCPDRGCALAGPPPTARTLTPLTFLAANVRTYAVPGYEISDLEADRLARLADEIERHAR